MQKRLDLSHNYTFSRQLHWSSWKVWDFAQGNHSYGNEGGASSALSLSPPRFILPVLDSNQKPSSHKATLRVIVVRL